MMGSYIVLILFAFLVEGVFGDKDEVMSVMKGNRVTLNTGVTKNPNDAFRWFFEDTLIALVNGHPNTSCLYYGKGEIFKDRLEEDYKTGSLIITTSRPEHTGRYEAEFIEEKPGKSQSSSIIPKCDRTQNYRKGSDLVIQKSFSLTVSDEVMSVMKGNRVTLNPDVTKNPNDAFRWYFEDTLIALVDGGPNTSCLYYGKGEIFKDRLEVDYKTGSLIITTSRPEHTGRYEAEFIEVKPGKTETFKRTTQICNHTNINRKGSDLVIQKSFSLTVSGVFGDKDEVMSVMEGNRVTLNPDVTKNPDDIFLWYFKDTLIALIDGGPNTSCLYYGKGEIFKDRLDMDYTTGSLIITTSRPEHTGRYEAEFIEVKPGKTETFNRTTQICNHTKIHRKGSDRVIQKSFSLTVSDLSSGEKNGLSLAVPVSGLSSGEIAGIVVGVVLLLAAAAVGVMIYRRRSFRNDIEKNKQKVPDQVSEEKLMISEEDNSSG